jgi:hypothetical protein
MSISAEHLLTTASVEEKVGRRQKLWWVGNRRGLSLIKEDGIWTQVEFPDDERITAADRFYRGGSKFVVSNEEADELVRDGFGHLLDLFTYDEMEALFGPYDFVSGTYARLGD